MAVLKQTGKLAPYNRPWQLIRDAVADLELQEKCKGVRIEMSTWHRRCFYTGNCYQCLAGAAMSRRCGVDTRRTIGPGALPWYVNRKLYAIDSFRVGFMRVAFYELGLSEKRLPDDEWPVTDYADDPAQFKSDMLDMADYLEELYGGKPVPKVK